MNRTAKKFFAGLFRMRGRKRSVVLLQWANWVLLGVSWGMSVRAYLRLPGRMALWLSLWRPAPIVVDRSLLFFIYPVIQAAVVFGGLAISAKFFVKRSDTEDIASLRSEVTHLELIFVSLLFIHLQTSLILLCFGVGNGINVSYMAVVAAVIIMLVPYYQIRRRILSR